MSKKEEQEALGKAVADAIKSGVRETTGDRLTGNAKVLNDILDEVVAQQQLVHLKIWRRGIGINANKEEFLKPLANIDPQLLKETGIEPFVQQYCGGGEYRVVISSAGVPSRTINMVIAGDPLPPKPEVDLRTAAQSGMMPPYGLPIPLPGNAGYNMATPGAAQYLGLAPAQQKQDTHVGDLAVLMQMMWAMQQQAQTQKASSSETDEMKKLQESLADMKAQLAAKDQERLRLESDARHAAEMAELKTQLKEIASASAQPKEDKLVGLVAALAPLAASVLQASQASQASQMQLLATVMGSQKEASKESVELVKAMMLQPRESETDRMQKVMEIATGAMSTTMGLTQAMVNQMAAMQPGERPWWQELLINGVSQMGELGQAILASRSGGGSDEEEEPQRLPAGAVRVLPASEDAEGDEAVVGVMDAAAAAAAAAKRQLEAAPEEIEEEEAEAEDEEAAPQVKMPEFNASAYTLIFEKIQDANTDAREIAFRLWKHASSGDKDALDWVRNPEGYTIAALDALARSGRILVTAERINQLADAMVELYLHFVSGGSAEDYLKKYGVTISLPKRIVVEPIHAEEELVASAAASSTATTAEEAAASTGEAEKEEKPKEVKEEVERPVASPTPTFGSAPSVSPQTRAV